MNFNYCPNCGQQTVQKESDTRYTCGSCDWVFWNNPAATVSVVFVKDGQLLFAKRGIEPDQGMYDLPGGFLEYNEDPYAGCIREIQEETGLHINRNSLELLEVYTGEYIPGVSVADLIFIARGWKGDFAPNDDVAALEWKSPEFINDQRFRPDYTGLDKKIKDVAGL